MTAVKIVSTRSLASAWSMLALKGVTLSEMLQAASDICGIDARPEDVETKARQDILQGMVQSCSDRIAQRGQRESFLRWCAELSVDLSASVNESIVQALIADVGRIIRIERPARPLEDPMHPMNDPPSRRAKVKGVKFKYPLGPIEEMDDIPF